MVLPLQPDPITMRYGYEEQSTHRKAPAVLAPEFLDYSEAPSEAPTHLPGTRRPQPVPYVQQSSVPLPLPLPPREKTERSEHQLQPHVESAPRRAPKATPQSVPVQAAPAPVAARAPTPAPVAAPVKTESKSASAPSASAPSASSSSSSSKSKTKSKHRSSSSKSAPQPDARPSSPSQSAPSQAAASQSGPAPQMPGMIDPLAVPVPPELGPTIYGWVRRLALQAELETADRVLRDALLEVSSSLSVSIIYPGQDGLWSLGPDEEIPREAGPIVAVAQARRAVIASHTALIPIVTTTETVAVVLLTRNPRNPAYQPIETLAMLGLARESAAILHHLAVLHLQRSHEQKLDRGGLYRPEALEAHRSRGQEGVPIHITPAWARRTFPFLVGAVVVALLFSIFIRVPTYSSGRGVIMLEGDMVTTQAQGTVDKIYLIAGTAVVKGTPIIKLSSKAEEDALDTATRNHENWAHQFLLENADANVKQQLAQAKLDLAQAKSRLDARTIRATRAGVISDISAVLGQGINPGEPVATIIDPVSTRPLVVAYLPSKDGPSMKPGMELQVGLDGYTKTREKAKIVSISREGIGAAQATKQMGATLADGLRLAPDATYVRVVAELPSRTFIDDHRKLSYRHGMVATTEVKISSKPFLVDMFPALERYVPAP